MEGRCRGLILGTNPMFACGKGGGALKSHEHLDWCIIRIEAEML